MIKSLKFLKRKFISLINGNYSYFYWLFPINDKKVVFVNYHGKGYGDSPKYIAEEILKRNYKLKLIWLVDKDVKEDLLPKEVMRVKYKSFRGLYELATAKVWIDNSRKFFYPPKRNKQVYLQTWHGSIAMKKIEKDAENELSHLYIEAAKKDGEICDYMLSNSDFSNNLYLKSFWFEGEVLDFGTPRTDIFFDKVYASKVNKKIKKHFSLNDKTKVILYAPTFRKNYSLDTYIKEFDEIINTMEEVFSGEYVVGIRLHPNISHLSNKITYTEKIINMSSYPDFQELLLMSDTLITDYSSSMFESLITYKKTFIYAQDLESYRRYNRELYFNFEELPFPISKNIEELILNISEFNDKDYCLEIKHFNSLIGFKEEGKASEQTVDFLWNVLNEEKK